MPNRVFDEIQADIERATSNSDAGALLALATEMLEVGMPALDVAVVYNTIGNIHNVTGDYPAALDRYHRALALHDEIGDRIGAAHVTGNIGTILYYTGDFPAALEHFNAALAVHAERGDRDLVASVIGNIGNVYYSVCEYDRAFEHYHRALALYHETGDRHGVAHISGSIGRAHYAIGDYSTALAHLRSALALNRELGVHRAAMEVMSVILETQIACHDIDDARQTLAELDGLHVEAPLVVVTREIARANLHVLDGDLDAASETLLKVRDFATERGIRGDVTDVYRALKDLAQRRNDLAAYIEYNDAFTRINEEINGKATATRLAMEAKQREIDAERKETEKQLAVLHSALPKHIADRVARGETVNDHYDSAAVIFLDIVGFTTITDRVPSGHVVHLLEQIFSTLDALCEKHGVVKIKTIGDSYMAVSFSNTQNQMPNAEHIASAGLCAVEMLAALNALKITMPPELDDTSWTMDIGDIQVRIGMHCGPVTAGVIGTIRMQYDVWGDTVNVASRMEGTSEPGRIHVSEAFAGSLTADSLTLTPRGSVEIKGKGAMTTYWLEHTS